MADTYRTPVPRVPADEVLDALDARAQVWLLRVDLDAEARRTLRQQRDAIRQLRIGLAKAKAERDSIAAIAKMASDERVAEQCPGSHMLPSMIEGGQDMGYCRACNQLLALRADDKWMVVDHAVPTL